MTDNITVACHKTLYFSHVTVACHKTLNFSHPGPRWTTDGVCRQHSNVKTWCEQHLNSICDRNTSLVWKKTTWKTFFFHPLRIQLLHVCALCTRAYRYNIAAMFEVFHTKAKVRKSSLKNIWTKWISTSLSAFLPFLWFFFGGGECMWSEIILWWMSFNISI